LLVARERKYVTAIKFLHIVERRLVITGTWPDVTGASLWTVPY